MGYKGNNYHELIRIAKISPKRAISLKTSALNYIKY